MSDEEKCSEDVSCSDRDSVTLVRLQSFTEADVMYVMGCGSDVPRATTTLLNTDWTFMMISSSDFQVT